MNLTVALVSVSMPGAGRDEAHGRLGSMFFELCVADVAKRVDSAHFLSQHSLMCI